MDEKEMTENEKKKLFLKSYLKNKQAVRRIEEQLEELRMNKMYPSVINDGMPHGTDKGDLSDYAARVDELERELVKKRYERIVSFQNVQAAIEDLEDETEKDLLTYRYLKGIKWEEIAVEMGYSWKHIHRIHATALKNLKMTWNDTLIL